MCKTILYGAQFGSSPPPRLKIGTSFTQPLLYDPPPTTLPFSKNFFPALLFALLYATKFPIPSLPFFSYLLNQNFKLTGRRGFPHTHFSSPLPLY